MCDADATVDGERCCQILIKAVEPRPIHFIHQLSYTNHLWKRKSLKEEGRRNVRRLDIKEGNHFRKKSGEKDGGTES